MSEKKLHRVIGVILCLVLLKGLIYGLLIPFDRSPDEKQHFRLIKAKQLQLNHASETERRNTAAQLELVSRFLSNPEADPQKYSVQDFVRTKLPGAPSSSQVYYLWTAWILKLLSLDNIRDEIYVVRSLSILCGVIVVFSAFLIVKELFPEHPFLLAGVPLLITFIPQFSAMNGVINNDKLAEVFASLFFWLMVKMFKYGMQGRYVAPYLLCMGLAVLSKRTAIFLFPVFLIMLLSYYWKGTLGWRFHLILIAIFLCIGLGLDSLAWYIDEIRKSTDSKVILFLREYLLWVPPHLIQYFLQTMFSGESLKYDAKFLTVMYWSFLGVFGYMTIHLHHFWYIAVALAQSGSLYGLLKYGWQIKRQEIRLERWQAKVLYLFAMSILLAVVIPFVRSVVLHPNNPMLTQGRYLFPVILPISLLTMVGMHKLFHPRYHRLVGKIGFIGLFLLEVVCLSRYLLLNFHFRSLF